MLVLIAFCEFCESGGFFCPFLEAKHTLTTNYCNNLRTAATCMERMDDGRAVYMSIIVIMLCKCFMFNYEKINTFSTKPE